MQNFLLSARLRILDALRNNRAVGQLSAAAALAKSFVVSALENRLLLRATAYRRASPGVLRDRLGTQLSPWLEPLARSKDTAANGHEKCRGRGRAWSLPAQSPTNDAHKCSARSESERMLCTCRSPSSSFRALAIGTISAPRRTTFRTTVTATQRGTKGT